MKATVEQVRLSVREGRLRAVASVRTQDGIDTEAFLPDRELSTILPRSMLTSSTRNVPIQLIETMEPMVRRMVKGRIVRMWTYEGSRYISFLSWRGVQFS
jgi:hypothetical protein